MNQNLISYIEENIFPIYAKNDRSHQLWHIHGVIERSLSIAKNYDVNLNMVYTIAAFHDIGNHIDQNNHEIESAKIFIQDAQMKLFFDKEELQTIKEAIEDHRASSKLKPRSIYGKIIITADKFITVDDILKSIHLYTLEKFPDSNWDEALNRCYLYLDNKYGENGYAIIPLIYPEYDNFLIDIRKLLKDKDKLSKELKRVDASIKNQGY